MALLISGSPSKWRLIRPFFLVLFLHAVAISFFTRGFLLTRTELSSFSHCDDIHQSPCSPPPTPPNATSSDGGACWTAPAVGRLIIIVLDALRFDFVAPSSFFEETKPWMDKLMILQKLAAENGSSARIFKAIADPPTTSLQRMKGLTTGGLPTFIDVGNSFGAPAITEDNLIHQLVQNGKKILMMGDDTWVQVFPDHFQTAYPYPSFNVKDLDTVDNGVIEHLLPSLYKEDWDVLIAHFLGVDHAGHIFGVDSTPMIQKLEQYNNILEEVVEVLKNQSGPGGLHENSFLVVMGDHGQTKNGDHGGGTAEEIETSLFAMGLRNPPVSVSSILDTNNCRKHLGGEMLCVSSIQQLDFAATVSALLGIPFPFGSIGRINPELYALSAGTWDGQRTSVKTCKSGSNLEEWMQNYANALCINSWQVKRYINLYSATSVIGLPMESLHHVSELYSQAQAKWSNMKKTACFSGNSILNGSQDWSADVFKRQIAEYSSFLESVAKIARSAWTEFDLFFMVLGLGVMLVSLFIQLFYFLCQYYYPASGVSGTLFRLIFASLFVLIRGVSFLSNSYILTEGSVANFLLATSGILNLRRSIRNGKYTKEEYLFLLIVIILRFGIEFGTFKQTGSASQDIYLLSILGVVKRQMIISECLPVFVLLLLVLFLYKSTSAISYWRYYKCFLVGTALSYMLIAVHWFSDSSLLVNSTRFQDFGNRLAPRIVYTIGCGFLLLSAFPQFFELKERASNPTERLAIVTVVILSAWSSTILILLGRQGPFVALICIIGAWCIIKLQKVACINTTKNCDVSDVDPVSVMQWSLLAVCLFFYTGHRCTFDGLRYGAAFIGFDHFNIIRQGFLLAIDTFGISHILPILGLPFLVGHGYQRSDKKQVKDIHFLNLTKVFLGYGLVTAVTTTFTILCVTIQKRHLMVWGLFAPKYVFDVIGLIVTDMLICVASLYYY